MRIKPRFSLAFAATLLAAAAAAPLPGFAADSPPVADLRGCSEQNIALLYPSALYRRFLPPGFRFPGLGLNARILVTGAYCESANGGGPSSSLLTFMEVVPTAAYADPAIPLYAIALTSYSDDPATVAVFAAAGFGGVVRPGATQVTAVSYPRLREVRGRVVAGDGDGQVITNSVVFGPFSTVPASRTRLFAVRDGAVVGIADGVYTEHPGLAGIGTLLKSGDGPAVAPIGVSVATHETGFDLTISPVPLPQP